MTEKTNTSGSDPLLPPESEQTWLDAAHQAITATTLRDGMPLFIETLQASLPHAPIAFDVATQRLTGLPEGTDNAQKLASMIVETHRLRQEAAGRDALTNTWNRTHLHHIWPTLWHGALRRNQPLHLGLIDLDRFKEINDTHGHTAGDAVLRDWSRWMQTQVRQADCFGRWGGDEFYLIWVDAQIQYLPDMVQRLRTRMASQTFGHTSPPQNVTCSIGIAHIDPAAMTHDHDADVLDPWLHQADRALYQAKQSKTGWSVFR